MKAQTFSVKVNGRAKQLVAFNREQAIQRACQLFKCGIENITRVKQLKR